MLAELTALWGFAFVQPVLDVFGRSPEQFVFRRADATVVVVFVLVSTVVPIVALWAIEQLGGLAHRAAGQVLHLAFVATLLGVIALRVLKRGAGLSGPVLAIATTVVAAGVTYLFVRSVVVRQWARFAALATVAFLLLFLFVSPATDLVRGDAVTASGATVSDPARVVMVVLDELPLESLIDADGTIEEQLYPNFADLARSSNWLRNATAVSPGTWHAVPAIATGRYPADGAPVARDHPDSIFTLLGGSYRMDVTESVTRLCPTTVCVEQDLDRGQSLRRLGTDLRRVVRSQLAVLHETDADPVAGLVENPAGGGVADFGRNQPERFTGFLSRIRPDEPLTLHYLHILLPHVPWRYLPSGLQYDFPDNDPGKVDDVWIDQAWPPQLARQRHLLQLRYVDGLVGDLLDRLRETDTFDDTLLVVTADHGIAFQPGQPVRGLEVDGFADAIHPDVMWVPMFVKTPGQTEGRTLDTNVETVDVVPTIADVLDVDLPWDPDGRSVFSDRPRGSTKTFFQSKVNVFGVDVGPRTEVDAADGWRVLRDRSVDTFLGRGRGDPADEAGLRSWLVGPRPDLVDLPVAGRAVGAATGVTASIDRAGELGSVDRASGRVPALLTGALGGAPDGPQTVVWSLNGRIAAVTPTYAEGDQTHAVAAMLPAPMLRDGTNGLELFLLGPGDRLEPIRLG